MLFNKSNFLLEWFSIRIQEFYLWHTFSVSAKLVCRPFCHELKNQSFWNSECDFWSSGSANLVEDSFLAGSLFFCVQCLWEWQMLSFSLGWHTVAGTPMFSSELQSATVEALLKAPLVSRKVATWPMKPPLIFSSRPNSIACISTSNTVIFTYESR